MDELCQSISHNHEVEFEYNGTTYVLQPEVNGDKAYLVIWDCTPNMEKCIAKQEINVEGEIPKNIIDSILSETCFKGKSFTEIEHEIEVTVIY